MQAISSGDFVTRMSVESDMGGDNQSDVDHADAVSIPDPADIEAGITDLLNGKHTEEQHGLTEQNENQELGQAHGDIDTVLANISKEFSNLEEAVEPISDKLASIVNGLWANKLSDDKLKDKIRKYPSPSNCNYMKVPKCNREIWSGSCMNSDARSTDIALQKAPSQVLRASVATIKVCDQLTTSKSKEKKDIPFKEMLVASIDSIAILGQAVQGIIQLRRDLIKPKLPFRLQKLAATVEQGAAELFSNDLNKRIRTIDETSKALVRNSKSNSFKKQDNQF